MTIFEAIKMAFDNGWIDKSTLFNKVADGKISAEEYRTICGEECELGLDVLKQMKIEELNKLCNETICNGFYSSASGEEIFYGYDNTPIQPDQANMSETLLALTSGVLPEPVSYKGKGEVLPLPYTKEQFIQLTKDASTHKVGNIQKYWTLKTQVLNAETKEEIEEIRW